jgi:hypothetical protein
MGSYGGEPTQAKIGLEWASPYGFAPVVLFAAPVASGATGAPAPRIRVTLLLPVFAIQTLPPRSTAIPAGVDSVGSVIPPDGDTAAPAFVKRLTLLLPELATHTWPLPSIATATLTEPMPVTWS